METAARTCPSCSSELPSGAMFCPRCGHATPTTITGGDVGYRPPDSTADAVRRRELQRLLGPTCELRDLIGRGGFADVFEAWDTRLKRTLAVKTLRVDLDVSDALLERFRREAEAIAQIRHPNIIPIYAVGGEGSVAFFTMPKIEGESLAALLKREPHPSLTECVRILRESASALAAAHRAGMVHRDVKPENIMLDGPGRHVLVMDFGIAKSIVGGAELTRTGMVMGTPHYMSPEQATAERTIDHRSDQYSLAVVGYRMLSGRLPFEGDTLQTLIYRQVSAPPAPLRDLAPDVPAELATVIERALAKDPADRFESIDAFAAALGSVLGAATPVAVRRARRADMPSRIAAMRAMVHWRQPLLLGAAAAVVGGLVTALRPSAPVRLEMAANRDDAVFAAKTFAANVGLAPPLRESASFENFSSRDFVFLLENLPGHATALDERVRAGGPGWHWEVTLRPISADTGALQVRVGAANRILGFRRAQRDTSTAVPVSAAVAESIATQQLRARGLDPAALRRLPDSVVTLRNRTDRIARWLLPGSAVAWRGDTAFTQVAVRVSGDRPASYTPSLVLPRTYPDDSQRLQLAVTVVMFPLFIIGAILATWLLVVRSKRDELQWALALRFGAVAVLATIPAWAASTFSGGAFVQGFSEGAQVESTASFAVAMSLVLKLLALGCFALVAVLVESLSADRRPVAFSALADLLRGRWRSPEVVTSVIAGASAGIVMWAAIALVGRAAMWRTGGLWTGEVPSELSAAVPAFTMLAHVANQTVIALFVALLQLAVLQMRRSAWLAAGAPMLLVLLQLLPPDSITTMGERLAGAAYLIGLSLVVWRYGVLAGGFAAALSDGIPSVLHLLRFSNAGVSQGLLAALVIVGPLAMAVLAYRRITGDAARVGAGG